MTPRRIPSSLAVMLLVVLPAAAGAQAPAPRVSRVQAAAPAAQPAPAPANPFDTLEFRAIGPATMSGRVDDLAVDERQPSTFYVATATGGLWKTTNNGTTWEVLFDDLDDVVSIGDVAIAPTDPNHVWVGTGENNNRQSSSWGNGVYKSTDGGRTWVHRGLRTSKQVARILVDPVDHDVVYVAALGDLWSAGGDRGVFKTADGGLTWTRVLHVDDDTGATELVMDPQNNKVLYAATYQRRRAVWGFNGGGPGSALWKSSDAGRSWTKLTRGIPDGPLGRVGIDVYRRDPDVLFARIEHAKESGVYRSDDAGASWRKVSDLNPRPMYFSQIRIDPGNDQRIYVLGVSLHVSDDGGRTWRTNESMHADHHAMWINPANPDHVIAGTDGGVGISWDGAKTFDYIDNMDLGQFYHVGYDMDVPYRVYGGLQDNNSWGGPSAVRSRLGISNADWFVVGGGDGFVVLADPKEPRIVYAESQDGRMNRIDRVTNERKPIRPEPAKGEPALRWNWNTPLVISPHDPATVYVAANRVFKSTDRGQSWTAISGDLTRAADRETLSLMNVVAKDFTLARHDGVQAYGTLVTFAESPRKPGLYYAGADDGTVHVSRDGGSSWIDVTARFPGLPGPTYVSRLVPSAHDENVVYATFDGHRQGDFRSHVYVSGDQGASWRAIDASLPDGHVVHVVTEDPKAPEVLYLGTEFGLFVSTDRGAVWMRWRSNLPTVPVFGIVVHPRDNDLLLATHGRSIWILDDLAPVQEWASAKDRDAHLFTPRAATFFNAANDRTGEGNRRFWGKNPPAGATLTYLLRSEPKTVALRIGGPGGSTVREIGGEALKDARKAGVNRVTWDLRHAPVPNPRGVPAPAGGGGFGAMSALGPPVMPGEYSVALVVDGAVVSTRQVAVAGDPLISITDEDRKLQLDTAMRLHEMHRAASSAAEAVAALGEQLKSVEALAALTEQAAELKDALAEAGKSLTELRRRFGVPQPGSAAPAAGGFGGQMANLRAQIGSLKSQITGSTSAPTEVQLRQSREHQDALTQLLAEVNALREKMPALLARVGGATLKAVPAVTVTR